MEIAWLPGGEFWIFDDNDRDKKPKVNYGPMGPKHPCWDEYKEEVRHQLKLAGRVFDETTVEDIAQDEKAWKELLTEASVNFENQCQQTRFNALVDMLRKVEKDTKSQKRLNDLFGGPTQVK